MTNQRRFFAALGMGIVALIQPIAGSAASRHVHIPANAYIAYDIGVNGGEPSIGVDPNTNAAMAEFGLTTLRVHWDEASPQRKPTISVVDPTTSQRSLDAILTVDSRTGRTFVSQLLGACSAMSFSDNDGASWTPTQGCGPGVLLDHQSVGVGPVHAPLPSLFYPGVVYYCAQNGFSGACATSLDGGATFGNAVPAYNTPANDPGDPNQTFAAEGGGCSALHGHMKVGPDGTAYLPLKGCGGQATSDNLTNTEFWGGEPALSISTDNGLTYTVHRVPGGNNKDESDPSVAIGRGDQVPGGRIYFGWEDGTNPSATGYGTTSVPKIATSSDGGTTWSKPVDVGAGFHIHNVEFPEVVAGDDNRAAFAWLGTTAIGDDQHNGFKGSDGKPAVWDLYVSTTYDGGKSWHTVDATPHDPVQRGCIDLQGTSNKNVTDSNICSQRNLLDFNDMTVDKFGRVLVVYADGCVGKCVSDWRASSKADRGTILRQSKGRGLFAQYDPVLLSQ
ncbi:MAG: sialidase family protein [Actinomycetota bacterium]